MVNKKYQDQEIFGSLKVNGTLTADDASTLSVAHAVTADNADRATNNEDGYRIKDIYLQKAGPDLTVGTPIGALSSSSGKTYLDCSIGPLTVSSGTYYFYNCSGSITINSSTVKLYLTNCPNLTVTEKYMGTVIRDGVTLLYDKDSSYNSLNWGYPSGITAANGTIKKDFSPYSHLIISAAMSDDSTGIGRVGEVVSIYSTSSSGNYNGRMAVFVGSDSITIGSSREWTTNVGNPTTIIDTNVATLYSIKRIEGVLK